MSKILITVLICILGLQIKAQNFDSVKHDKFAFSDGDKDVFKATFTDVSAKEVQKGLETFLKKYKAKLSPVKGHEGEYTVDKVVFKDVHRNETKMHVKIAEFDKNTMLYIQYETEGAIVNEESKENDKNIYNRVTSSMANSATYVAYNNALMALGKDKDTKEKELTSLKKEEEKLKESVSKSNLSINASRNSLTSLQSKLSNYQVSLKEKQDQISAKENEIASQDIGVLKSQIKDIEKENKDIEKEISKIQDKIGKSNGEVSVMETELLAKDEEIKAQKNLLSVNADKKVLKQVQSLEKERAKSLSNIEEIKHEVITNMQLVEKNRVHISSNREKITDINTKISAHNIDALKDQLKLLEKDLKEIQGNISKTEKDIEKENSSVSKELEEIKEADSKILEFQKLQSNKQQEIDVVSNLIKETTEKQNSFK